jgi:hypothetical protein
MSGVAPADGGVVASSAEVLNMAADGGVLACLVVSSFVSLTAWVSASRRASVGLLG